MDSRFPTYYMNDRRIMKMMTAEQFRLFVMATAWSVSNMTDGHIAKDELYLIPFANEDDVQALVKCGVWTVTADGWLIADFKKAQTSAAKMEVALENRLAKDRDRQQKSRDKKKEEDASRDDHVSFERQRKGKAEAEALDVGSSKSEAEAQAVWDATPSSDPGACRTCSQGRPTPANIKRGIFQCLDCISKQRSAA